MARSGPLATFHAECRGPRPAWPKRTGLCLGSPKDELMPETDRASESEGAPAPPSASACQIRPGRTLIVENDNRQGWLAADLCLDLEDWR